MTPNINKILKTEPRNSNRGAPMGNVSYFDNPDELLYVQRVSMVDGDYATDGTYWGGYPSDPLYCAFSDNNRIYVRAKDRSQAIAAVLTNYVDAQFHFKGKTTNA